ncbi:hypothetical protein OV142_29035 [Nannocystis sp. SCPEA4]|nr:hypothetical protein [Nannocystis sp. SCPEA4]
MFDFKVFLPSVALALVTGCKSPPTAPADSDGTTTTTTTTTATATTTTTGTSPTSTVGETTSSTTGSTSESVDSGTSDDGSYIIIPDLGPQPPCDCAEDELCVYEIGTDSWFKICVTPPDGCAPQQKCSAACMQACVHPTPPRPDCDSDPAEALVCDYGSSSTCSPWGQNCPEGQKCAPLGEEVGSNWELECVPLADPAPAVGEPCLGPAGSPTGKDDCAAGALCWPIGGDGEKKCVANCGGTPDEPECAGDQVCATLHEGTITACLPICDPLVQDCPIGQVCSPGLDGFACLPDTSGADGDLSDACSEDDRCDPGFHCLPSQQQSNCVHSSCCTPFCDVNAPDCPFGSACVSPYSLDDTEPPPDWDHVGVCVKP